MHHDIQHIIQGKKPVEYGTAILAVINYLEGSQTTSNLAESHQQRKEEETARLKDWISKSNAWVKDLVIENYISQGLFRKF